MCNKNTKETIKEIELKSKHLCQRGTNGDAFSNVLGALCTKVIISEINARQRVADADGISNCFRSLRSVDSLSLLIVVVTSNAIVNQIDLCTTLTNLKLEKKRVKEMVTNKSKHIC